MDPHFNEYLAAVAGMHDTYGEPDCDGCTDFHHDHAEAPATEQAMMAA